MSRRQPDRTLDTLVDLDGQVLVVDPAGKHWVRFAVKRVPTSPERPQGIAYSLTLHDADGQRLVGFDNAHPVRTSRSPAGRARQRQDHKHRLSTVRPYDYTDAATLLGDFWAEVDRALGQRGVIA